MGMTGARCALCCCRTQLMATCEGVRPISLATCITASASSMFRSSALRFRFGSVVGRLYLPVSFPGLEQTPREEGDVEGARHWEQVALHGPVGEAVGSLKRHQAGPASQVCQR